MRVRRKIIIFCASITIILALIVAFFIIPKRVGHVDKKEDKARFEIENIGSLLEEYYKENVEYPRSLNTLTTWLKQSKPDSLRSINQLLLDPWNVPYNYRYPGTYNKDGYDLWSYGADNLPGGEGKDKDITNWNN